MPTKSALVLLADGAEEMELVISVDVLRRAGVSYFMLLSFLRVFYNWNCIVIPMESELFVLMSAIRPMKLQLGHSCFMLAC
jgi:hypothetical protein